MYIFFNYTGAQSHLVDATISFGDGLTVSWKGQVLGLMKMDDVKVAGDVGATLDVQTTFEVADVNYLTEFTKVGVCLLDVPCELMRSRRF